MSDVSDPTVNFYSVRMSDFSYQSCLITGSRTDSGMFFGVFLLHHTSFKCMAHHQV